MMTKLKEALILGILIAVSVFLGILIAVSVFCAVCDFHMLEGEHQISEHFRFVQANRREAFIVDERKEPPIVVGPYVFLMNNNEDLIIGKVQIPRGSLTGRSIDYDPEEVGYFIIDIRKDTVRSGLSLEDFEATLEEKYSITEYKLKSPSLIRYRGDL